MLMSIINYHMNYFIIGHGYGSINFNPQFIIFIENVVDQNLLYDIGEEIEKMVSEMYKDYYIGECLDEKNYSPVTEINGKKLILLNIYHYEFLETMYLNGYRLDSSKVEK